MRWDLNPRVLPHQNLSLTPWTARAHMLLETNCKIRHIKVENNIKILLIVIYKYLLK